MKHCLFKESEALKTKVKEVCMVGVVLLVLAMCAGGALASSEGVEAALRLVEEAHGAPSCRRASLADVPDFEWRLAPGSFQRQADTALNTATVLNHYLLLAPNDTELDSLFLYSLVRANVAGDASLSSSGIVLGGEDGAWAVRGSEGGVQPPERPPDLPLPANLSTALWTAPFVDCNLTAAWQLTYGVPFFARAGDQLNFKGVVSVSLPLDGIDINQCDGESNLSAFSSSHHCDPVSTQCVFTPGKGFRRGGYRCYCKPHFYASEGGVGEGSAVEAAWAAGGGLFRCLPCRLGCESCSGPDQPCFVEYGLMLRSLVLCFQSFCSTLVIILIGVVFVLRKKRIFSSSMWVMLETILIGALFLYQTVIIRYFEPSVITCMLEPWFRGLGFSICYGGITLKIYRILAEFQTRKAHRVCVRDKDLLKYLMGIITIVIGYMLAWTAVIIDNMNEGYSVVAHEQTPMGLKYVICRAMWWDYVTEVGELLFLLFGVFLTYKVRNARSDCFYEKETLAWSIYVEALVSLLMYIIRHVVWSNLQPDYIYLLYFLRCQCTVTIILFFIFAPKLWYHARPPEVMDYQSGRQLSSCGDVRDHMPEAMKLHEAITSNGDVDFSDINIADMDPEDIRIELRRVYTQLQVLRNMTMRKGNPHISRRRGGRKGTHRRFSLQTFHHRHKHYHDHEVTEVSKTPEESTASLDAEEQEPRA